MGAQSATATREPAKQSSKELFRSPVAPVQSKLAAPPATATPTSLRAIPALAPGERWPGLLPLQRKLSIGADRVAAQMRAAARRETGEQEVAAGVESTIERKRGGGQALDDKLRAHMESAFGSDFSGVRVHTDGEAGRLNRSVNALAFTTGQDIFFAPGAYRPDSSAGRELVAHELTHVVQQGSRRSQGKLVLGKPGDRYEQEADAAARQVGSAPFGSLHRKCACGGGSSPGGECESCKEKREAAVQAKFLQRVSASPLQSESVHPEEQHCEDVSKDSTATCTAIIDCINELIEALAGRFADFENQGGDEGHRQRIEIVQNILRTLMTLAGLACKNGEYDKELEEEARKWADKKPQQERQEEDGESVWDKLRKYLPEIIVGALIAVGVVAIGFAIAACFASGACEFAFAVAGLGLLLAAAVTAALRAAGVQDTPSGGPVAAASTNGANTDDNA